MGSRAERLQHGWQQRVDVLENRRRRVFVYRRRTRLRAVKVVQRIQHIQWTQDHLHRSRAHRSEGHQTKAVARREKGLRRRLHLQGPMVNNNCMTIYFVKPQLHSNKYYCLCSNYLRLSFPISISHRSRPLRGYNSVSEVTLFNILFRSTKKICIERLLNFIIF